MPSRGVVRDVILAFVALTCLTISAAFLIGAISVGADWREGDFGSDGWPVDVVPSAVVAGVFAIVGLGLMWLMLKRHHPGVVIPVCLAVASWSAYGVANGMGGSWLFIAPLLAGTFVIALTNQRQGSRRLSGF